MTLRQIIIIWTICLFSCRDNSQKISVDKTTDSTKTENAKRIEPDLSDIKTPAGNIIKYKRTGDNFQIQWFQDGQLQTFVDTFQVYGAEIWIPRFEDENENFVILRAGCGSNCWFEFFLPLKRGLTAKSIDNPLAFDIKQNYVAYVVDSLEILNFKTDKLQKFPLDSCTSDVMPYICIDTIYFGIKSLSYKWDHSARWDYTPKKARQLRIKI